MANPYESRSYSVDRAAILAQIEADEALEGFVDDSAGTDPSGTTVYRPYWAAAMYLEANPQKIESAEGVKFASVLQASRSLRGHQWALDAKYKLTVPDGMDRDSYTFGSGYSGIGVIGVNY